MDPSSFEPVTLRSRSDSFPSPFTAPRTPDEEFRIGSARAHFRRTYREIRPLAAGSNGETYVAIPKHAAAAICDSIGQYGSDKAFFGALRSEVVVAKFAKRGRGRKDDLINEITFLARKLPKSTDKDARLPICKLTDYHQQGNRMWLTLEFVQGGDLHEFIKRHRHDLTLPFRWHICLQLAQAIAYLHYGVSDLAATADSAKSSWPQAYHADLHGGNLLLTASGEGSYKDYPDVILTDFGCAKTYRKPASTSTQASTAEANARTQFNVRQLSDLASAGYMMEGLMLVEKYKKLCEGGRHCACGNGCCPRADCTECLYIARWWGKLKCFGPDEDLYLEQVQAFRNFRGATAEHTAEETLAFLRAFAKIAAEQQDEHYRPLSCEARSTLSSEKVSDNDLRRTLQLDSFFGE